MKPSIGRIVIYKTNSAQPYVYPAIINKIDPTNGEIGLHVFEPDAGFQTTAKSMAEGPRQAEPGQWWWPERI